MIVLPNLPPFPKHCDSNSKIDTSIFLADRASLASSDESSTSVSYVDKLEQYVEKIFEYLYNKNPRNEVTVLINDSFNTTLMESKELPWYKLTLSKERGGKSRSLNKILKYRPDFANSVYKWNLGQELQASVLAIVSSYIELGSRMINDLIEAGDTSEQKTLDEKWKQVGKLYRKGISFSMFGTMITKDPYGENQGMSEALFTYLRKICELCIQISVMCKWAAENRAQFNVTQTFSSTNNGTLAKVSIYVYEGIKSLRNMTSTLKQDDHPLTLDLTSWDEYLSIMEKYALAYSAMFLSFDLYQKEEIGKAIGLANVGLISLQSKHNNNNRDVQAVNKVKNKMVMIKKESFVRDLRSNTTLDLDKSVFRKGSGMVLKDLSLVFDQLILLRLKYVKENDNLRFQEVIHYDEVGKDIKWPLGTKVPEGQIEAFSPRVISLPNSNEEYHGRGAYF